MLNRQACLRTPVRDVSSLNRTPGPHPYLAVRPEAYSVLDSVRAVLTAFPEVANKVVLVGQSQGAGAAFATAGLAARYAPEVALRGTVATGLPFLEAPPRRLPTPSDTPDRTTAYLLYVGVMMQQRDPALTAESLFTPRAQPLFEAARTTCVRP